MTEHDQEGIPLPSTTLKISQSENVRTRAFRSVEERDEYIRMMVCKCEGLYTFYKLWIAARILDVTKDEIKLLVKDRVHPVGDIIFRYILGHETPRRTWTRSSVDVPIGCPLGTGMLREDADCGTMWVSPHLLLASHRHCFGGTAYVMIYIHVSKMIGCVHGYIFR